MLAPPFFAFIHMEWCVYITGAIKAIVSNTCAVFTRKLSMQTALHQELITKLTVLWRNEQAVSQTTVHCGKTGETACSGAHLQLLHTKAMRVEGVAKALNELTARVNALTWSWDADVMTSFCASMLALERYANCCHQSAVARSSGNGPTVVLNEVETRVTLAGIEWMFFLIELDASLSK